MTFDTGPFDIIGRDDAGLILLLEISSDILRPTGIITQCITRISDQLVQPGSSLISLCSHECGRVRFGALEIAAGYLEIYLDHINIRTGIAVRDILVQGIRRLILIPVEIVIVE